jgi:hypothetical protein
MNIARDVLRELRGMFVADARLTIGLAVLIAIVTALVAMIHVKPLVAGGVLLVGCLGVLIESATHKARQGASR